MGLTLDQARAVKKALCDKFNTHAAFRTTAFGLASGDGGYIIAVRSQRAVSEAQKTLLKDGAKPVIGRSLTDGELDIRMTGAIRNGPA